MDGPGDVVEDSLLSVVEVNKLPVLLLSLLLSLKSTSARPVLYFLTGSFLSFVFLAGFGCGLLGVSFLFVLKVNPSGDEESEFEESEEDPKSLEDIVANTLCVNEEKKTDTKTNTSKLSVFCLNL